MNRSTSQKKISRTETYQTPQIYGIPKVYKNKFPVPLNSVVSQYGSLLAIASTCINYKLAHLVKFVNSYIKNSSYVINVTKEMTHVPKNTRWFTSDTEAMYPNIHFSEDIPLMENYLWQFGTTADPRLPIGVIMDLLNSSCATVSSSLETLGGYS